MVHEILSSYDIPTDHLEVLPISNGLINETWLIKNSHKDFILQKINHHIFKDPDAIAYNVRLIANFLSQHHPEYLFIAPIKTKANNEMKYIEGSGYFRLLPFVRRSNTINTVRNPQQAYEAAKMFGEFTNILSNFPIAKLKITLPDFHNLSLKYKQFLTALKNGNKQRIENSGKLISFIKANKNIVDTYESILQNPCFKLRVTHHDTKISNVLFSNDDKGLCVIDLDTVMAGYFISDVGDMIRTYLSPVNEEEKDFSKINIREDYFIAIYKGYMSEMQNKLTNEEREHFIYAGKFMIYMQLVRFLTDYLNNDIYYDAKYEDQNLIRAGNQAVLLQCLLDGEAKLQSLIE